MTRCAILLSMLSAITFIARLNSAQDTLEIPAATASDHLTKRVEPVYPAIAKAMRLQGKVILKVVVTEVGEVDSAKQVSGPQIFLQAAIDAVMQWRYRPFLADGNAVRATFQVEVPFSLGIPEDQQNLEQQANQTFFARIKECRALLDGQEYTKAEAPCVSLTELAEKLPKEQQLERMEANRFAGLSLFAQKKFPQALGFFQREAAIAETMLHPTDAELGEAYEHLAWGYQSNGDLQKAATFYLQAETKLRKAREHMGTSEFFKNEYAKQIYGVLIYYIALLHQTGQENLAAQAQERADAIAKEIHQ